MLTKIMTAILFGSAILCAYADDSTAKRPPDAIFTQQFYDPGPTMHIVLFKYKTSVTTAQKKEVVRRFLALQPSPRQDTGKSYILYINSGVQNSLEGVARGFEQGFIVAFKSGGDRNYYVGKPIVNDPDFFDHKHDEFKNFVGPLLAEDNGVLVFDFKNNQ
jgi:hypothetical protein